MKKLSQTWRQKRPRNLSNSSSRNVGKGDGIKGSQEETEHDLNFLPSFGGSFDWTVEELGTIKKGKSSEKEASHQICYSKVESFKSPSINGLRLLRNKKISTPTGFGKETHSDIFNALISPVSTEDVNAKKIITGGDVLLFENKENLRELNNIKDHSQSRKDFSSEIKKKEIQEECLSHKPERPSLEISSWNLPECVVNQYRTHGIDKIFEWQRECLLTGKALSGGNLVYSAPTSAGKTLVAEILMLKRVLQTKRKAIYVLPFVSVAREKMFSLQGMFREADVRVDGYMGAQAPSGGFIATDIAVCTIEKANSLVNRLMEEKKMSSLGIVVIDEMHMIGDGHRGYLLELMLTKIRFLQRSYASDGLSADSGVQIVGMSATLPNLNMLADWLGADLYLTDYRPVPLVETIKVGRSVMDQNLQKMFEIDERDVVNRDEDHIVPLCLETIRNCHSVLIFCPTKQWCERLAKNLADHFKHLLAPDAKQGDPQSADGGRTALLDAAAIAEVIEQLKRTPAGLDRTVADVVSCGVSFHHAGLTFDERDIIEGAFKRGAVRVLVATSTLSSGVNLPARRVILRTPIFHGKVINSLVYKQMTGRAGRKGVDTTGESILICKPSEKQKGAKLLKSQLDPVYSCLIGSGNESEIAGMKRALLEIIAGDVATTRDDVEAYAKCTYLNYCLGTKSGCDPANAIKNTILFLIENEFIRGDKAAVSEPQTEAEHEEKLIPTQLGVATLASALSPDEALIVFKELQKARRCFVLENELHVVYQVMPIYMQSQWPELDWYRYFSIYEKLPPQYKRVGEIVGVEEAFLAGAVRGRVPTRSEAQRQKLAVHQRFYSALVLLELVNEIPLRTVSRRYNVSKGLLQSLQNSASTFAGMVTKFCQKLGWRNLEMLVDQFQSRLSFGVNRELCDLVRISSLNGARARLLYNAGYHTVGAIAASSADELRKLLENFAPFESDKNLQGESGWEIASKKRLRSFWVSGRAGMTEAEAAEFIISEAKELVQGDLAALGVQMDRVHFMANQSATKEAVEAKGQPSGGGVLSSKVTRNCDVAQGLSKDGLANMASDKHHVSTDDCTERASTLPHQRKDISVKDGAVANTGCSNVVPDCHAVQSVLKEKSTQKILNRESVEPEVKIMQKRGTIEETSQLATEVEGANIGKNRENTPPRNTSATTELEGIGSETSNRKRSFDALSNDSKNQEYFQLSSSLNTQDFEQCLTGSKTDDGESRKKTIKTDCLKEEGFKEEVAAYGFVENSLKDTSGSFILIDSKDEDFCFNGEGLKKDTSMELFSQEHFDDADCDADFTEKRKQATSTNSHDHVFEHQAVIVDTVVESLDRKGGSYTQGECHKNVDVESILEKQRLNDTEHTANDLKGSNNVSYDGSTSSILFDSFGTCNLLSPANNNDNQEQSFCLKLSESFTGEAEASHISTNGTGNSPLARNQQNAFQNIDSVNNRQGLSGFANNGAVIEGAGGFGNGTDTEIVMSGSDSFTNALCDIGLDRPAAQLLGQNDEPVLKLEIGCCNGKKRRSSVRIAKRRSSNDGCFRIIDAEKEKFDSVMQKLKTTKVFSFSVARASNLESLKKQDNGSDISGISVCFGGKTSFFVDFHKTNDDTYWGSDANKHCAIKMILAALRDSDSIKRTVFDAKEHCKVLMSSFSIELEGIIYDPKVAAWLLDPSAKEPTFHELALRYLPDDYKEVIHSVGSTYDKGSIGLTRCTAASPRLRASVEAVACYKLMEVLEMRLVSEGLFSSFLQVEMPVIHTVAKLEFNGFGFSPEQCDILSHKLKTRLRDLEAKARALARRPFSINAPEEVAQVLFIELGLPPSGDPDVLVAEKRGPGGKRCRTKHLSTAKGVLEKLENLHPLPSVILEWRKINKALTSVVYPMQHLKVRCESAAMFRIHPCYQLHTVTGRMVAVEPCIQHVPKDFGIALKEDDDVTTNVFKDPCSTVRSKEEGPKEEAKYDVSMRTAFVPAAGGVLVSADYSQLELRIIAHLSRDKRLLKILNSDGDVFRMVAAEINQCGVDDVNERQRQSAKHVCYGIIYGIGPKALAEKLHVSDDTAMAFMEKFKGRFVGIKEFTKRTVDFARAKGYVLTTSGRKRYFSTINSKNAQSRSLAERQAVNTAIQGSAADLVKCAMVRVDKRISVEFPKDQANFPCPVISRINTNWLSEPRLILQLHDELIYECSAPAQERFIRVLKTEMEQALKLEVRLPVKIRTGKSWGELKE